MQNKTEQAVFGGGCFWCTEAVFKMLNGVSDVYPAYAGGTKPNPTYDDVCTGTTGYVEVVSVIFDPEIISYQKLMTVFFGSHDPSQVNRQGNDVGTQYRSVIFYTTDEQKKMAENLIIELNSQSGGEKIVTTVEPLTTFYKAETYHQDYFAKHKEATYCQLVINPKLEKIQKEFAELLKTN